MKLIIDLPDRKELNKLKEIEQKLNNSGIEGLVIQANKALPGIGQMGPETLLPSITATIKAAQAPLTKLVEVIGNIASLWRTEIKLSKCTEQGEKQEIGIITSKLKKEEILEMVKVFVGKDEEA